MLSPGWREHPAVLCFCKKVNGAIGLLSRLGEENRSSMALRSSSFNHYAPCEPIHHVVDPGV